MNVAYLRLSLLVLWIEECVFPRSERYDQPTMSQLVLHELHHFQVNWYRLVSVRRLELVRFEWVRFLRRFSHLHWRHPHSEEHVPRKNNMQRFINAFPNSTSKEIPKNISISIYAIFLLWKFETHSIDRLIIVSFHCCSSVILNLSMNWIRKFFRARFSIISKYSVTIHKWKMFRMWKFPLDNVENWIEIYLL